MKIFIHHYIVYSFIFIQSLSGMERNSCIIHNDSLATQLNDIVNSTHVCFIDENNVAIVQNPKYQKNNVTVQNILTQKPSLVIPCDHKILDIAINKNTNQIAVLHKNLLCIYNSQTGNQEEQYQLDTDHSSVNYIHHTHPSFIIHDRFVSGWTVFSQQESPKIYKNPHDSLLNTIHPCDYHPSLPLILSNCSESNYLLYDYQNDNIESCYFSNHYSYWVRGVLYNHDGSLIAKLLDDQDGTSIEILTQSQRKAFYQFNKKYRSICFHPNKQLFFLLEEKNIVECWNIKTHRLIYSINLPDQPDHASPILEKKRLALSPDGNILIVATAKKCFKVLTNPTLYNSDFIKQLFCTYQALRLYNHDHIVLPQEICYEIIQKLLTVYLYQPIHPTKYY